jgi:N-methylhydantoinase A
VTVTDANFVLGRLDTDHFLGGAMPLHPEAARAALASLAAQMGLSVEAAALGIIDVANVNIDRALRQVSVARGHDPRDFTLIAFGGAGPMHACEVAAGLEIPRVLVPRHPGILCAYGLLMADVVLETSRSMLGSVSAESDVHLEGQLEEMIVQARSDLTREGVAEEEMVYGGLVDARYHGQSYELTIPFPDPGADSLRAAFHAAHARRYGHAMPERAVEVVNLRLQATGLVAKPELDPEPLVENDGADAYLGQKPGYLRSMAQVGPASDLSPNQEDSVARGSGYSGYSGQMALYDRALLRPGAAFVGPALVLQMDSTVYVGPRWSARVDGYRNIVLERT